MASTTCELVWLKQLLKELQFGDITHICDNQATFHISINHIFHKRIKYIEIHCHFIREKNISRNIKIEFVNSSDHLTNIFNNSLRGPQINYICNKFGTYNLYAPT